VRVGLLSDVHANLEALEAVLAGLGRVDALWVTGDTVGYGPDPSEVLALLRARGALLVQGNHDRAIGTGEGLDWFNEQAARAAELHATWLSSEERDALAAMPRVVAADPFTLCHGSLRDPMWEYVTRSGAARATIDLAGTAHACVGHTHVPAVFVSEGDGARLVRPAHGDVVRLDGRCLVNPGSVGQPRDGDPRASYAVIDTLAHSATFYRASYPVAETQRRMRARGLPSMLAERLAYGV
jgi:predicted phosphodiesterase